VVISALATRGRGVPVRRRRFGRGVAALACAAGVASQGACASTTKPREVCLRYEASPNLNIYDGQPHAVTLYLYPLAATAGFEQASIEDLLGGSTPPGVLSSPVHFPISPGQGGKFEDLFPGTTAQIGVVADYYRAAGDAEGTRRQVIPADCGWFPPTLVLSPTDLLLD
jgi:type VI secretion system VasD/TssJ family lipoprotein